MSGVKSRIYKGVNAPSSQLGDNILAVDGTSCTLYKAESESFTGPGSIGIRMECKQVGTGEMKYYEKIIDGSNADLANFTEIGNA